MGRILYSLQHESTAASPSTPVIALDNTTAADLSSAVPSPPRSPSPLLLKITRSDFVINQRPYTRETAEFMEEFLSGSTRPFPEDSPYADPAFDPPVGGVPMRRDNHCRRLVRTPSLEGWAPLTEQTMNSRRVMGAMYDYARAQHREMDLSGRDTMN